MSDGLTEDDKLVLAYVAGAVTVAVVIPAAFIGAVKYIPPFREAVRRNLVIEIDAFIGRTLATLPPNLRTYVGVADAYLRVSARQPLVNFLHDQASVNAADAVVEGIVNL